MSHLNEPRKPKKISVYGRINITLTLTQHQRKQNQKQQKKEEVNACAQRNALKQPPIMLRTVEKCL